MLASASSRWLFAAPPAPGVVDDRLRARRLKRVKKAAQVKPGTLHNPRHFFVGTMANANVSPFNGDEDHWTQQPRRHLDVLPHLLTFARRMNRGRPTGGRKTGQIS
jgi:hypothetical protein